jgi:hypothetical protein
VGEHIKLVALLGGEDQLHLTQLLAAEPHFAEALQQLAAGFG